MPTEPGRPDPDQGPRRDGLGELRREGGAEPGPGRREARHQSAAVRRFGRGPEQPALPRAHLVAGVEGAQRALREVGAIAARGYFSLLGVVWVLFGKCWLRIFVFLKGRAGVWVLIRKFGVRSRWESV